MSQELVKMVERFSAENTQYDAGGTIEVARCIARREFLAFLRGVPFMHIPTAHEAIHHAIVEKAHELNIPSEDRTVEIACAAIMTQKEGGNSRSSCGIGGHIDLRV